MKNKGITLVALIITIVVLITIAFITISLLQKYEIINYSETTTRKSEISSIKEQISLAYSKTKIQDSKAKGQAFFEKLKENIHIEGALCIIKENSLLIITKENYSFEILENGTIIDETTVILDIADGCIDIKSNGYVRGKMTPSSSGYKVEGELIEYTGTYIITGNSNTNAIRLMDTGTYDVILKDININLKGINISACAFNGNKGNHKTGKYVNLYLIGNNTLVGTAAGIGFIGGTSNINGVTTGSTLTIGGPGNLYVEGGGFCAGIGSGYNGLDAAVGVVSNIVINSGTITAKPGTNGCAIGGGFKKNVNNIIIYGGTINAIASNRAGIGAAGASVDNLIINGGNISVTGGEYGAAIGGGEGSGRIVFNGGNVTATKQRFKADSLIGQGCKIIEINGGTINGYSENGIGIGSTDNSTQKIIIRGGTLEIDAKARKIFY